MDTYKQFEILRNVESALFYLITQEKNDFMKEQYFKKYESIHDEKNLMFRIIVAGALK
jgi:hypothetical protein